MPRYTSSPEAIVIGWDLQKKTQELYLKLRNLPNWVLKDIKLPEELNGPVKSRINKYKLNKR